MTDPVSESPDIREQRAGTSALELVQRVVDLRAELEALDQRIHTLSDEFEAVDPESLTDAAEADDVTRLEAIGREVIECLSDAHLDLRTADTHLETAISKARKLVP
ncbi:MAG: hypothetical protein WAW17_08570 [Rhodococcus sp. (in: high G+C Gram-positive bacteria)]|uniref:hypothetical protein n=1 Tax=Rhodococcus sp. TaxID=1831 RepID=UPI003BB04A86